MFGNIKKKLNSVIQEGITLSENFSTQLKLSSPDKEGIEFGVPADIKLTAGCRLLRKFEDSWKEIHEANEENAKRAEDIDKLINEIKMKADKDAIDIADLNSCLQGVPALKENLKACVGTLNEICKLCETIEIQLVQLEDVCEECELQEQQLEEKFKISLYKQKKMADLENYRQTLAAKHQDNVRIYEDELRKIQLERQAVFQDAFLNDLETFKQKGSIPKVNQKTADSDPIALEEVVLDDVTENKDELEDFLNG